MGRTRRANTKLMTMIPGMMASAVTASRQFSVKRITTAISRRTTEIEGEMIASCRRPVVVSTSPVIRDRMPPVFMSQSVGSGRCNRRSKSDRRSVSITWMFSSFWR